MATPRYREIADELRHEIHTGRLLPGDQIPTEQELRRRYEVSLNTIRAAVQVLLSEGVLETRGRQGRYVRDLRIFEYHAQVYVTDPGYFEGVVPHTDSWTRQVAAANRHWEQDFRMSLEPAESSVAERLSLTPEELVCVRDCHRFIDGTPWCDEVTFYVREVAERCGLDTPHDIPEGTVRRLADRGFVEIHWEDRIEARPATQQEINDFEISVATPILIHDRVSFIEGEPLRPIRLTRQLMPADRNRIRYELARSTPVKQAS